MQPRNVPSTSPPAAGYGGNWDDPPSRVAASARGWHRIQLAVLGFIGFCGVLWIGGDPSGPGWLQWLAGGLVLLALALACLAIYLVGRVAYPLHDPADAGPSAMAGAARRLRAGIRVTYLAVVVLVVATLSGWWPHVAGTGLVEARAATGQVWCGAVVDAPAGAVALDTADGPVTLLLDQISTLRPVDEC